MKNKLINGFYFLAGIPFLILAKIKNTFVGYTPKPFSTDEALKCSIYNIEVVEDWLKQLSDYQNEDGNSLIKNKTILELGPGSDLGIGLYLLSKGVKKYYAIDVYELASQENSAFYNVFFEHLKSLGINTESLAEELSKALNKKEENLNFICQQDFDIAKALKDEKIDIFFSNAAFEHFENIEQTIKGISTIASDNAVLVISIDLITHSRWIREKDPNNIYRYPKWLYKLLTTKSSPNRVRPYQYKQILKDNGWGNITVQVLDGQDDINNSTKYLSKEFKDSKNDMNCYTVGICATRIQK